MTHPEFAETIELAVPADYAFEFLADPATATVIDPAVLEYRPDTAPMAKGTRNHIRFRMWGLPITMTSLVTDWIPGRRMVMENVKPSRPVRAVATHSFAETGAGCAYTWQMEFVPVGVLGSLAARTFRGFMRKNALAQQVRFKAEVERRWALRNS